MKEVGKPSLTIFLEKGITSAHFNSSNSSGFNPILQKFYKMIFGIIVSKTLGGIFLIFCRSIFINNFMVRNSFLEPKNQRKLNASRFVSRNFRTEFCRSYLYKLAGRIFSPKIFFQGLSSFFRDCNATNLGVFFFLKKIILYFFPRVII